MAEKTQNTTPSVQEHVTPLLRSFMPGIDDQCEKIHQLLSPPDPFSSHIETIKTEGVTDGTTAPLPSGQKIRTLSSGYMDSMDATRPFKPPQLLTMLCNITFLVKTLL